MASIHGYLITYLQDSWRKWGACPCCSHKKWASPPEARRCSPNPPRRTPGAPLSIYSCASEVCMYENNKKFRPYVYTISKWKLVALPCHGVKVARKHETVVQREEVIQVFFDDANVDQSNIPTRNRRCGVGGCEKGPSVPWISRGRPQRDAIEIAEGIEVRNRILLHRVQGAHHRLHEPANIYICAYIALKKTCLHHSYMHANKITHYLSLITEIVPANHIPCYEAL